jgi:hypothetical protein
VACIAHDKGETSLYSLVEETEGQRPRVRHGHRWSNSVTYWEMSAVRNLWRVRSAVSRYQYLNSLQKHLTILTHISSCFIDKFMIDRRRYFRLMYFNIDI